MWSVVFTFAVTRAGRLVLRGREIQKRRDSDERTRQWLSEAEAIDVSEGTEKPHCVSCYMLFYI